MREPLSSRLTKTLDSLRIIDVLTSSEYQYFFSQNPHIKRVVSYIVHSLQSIAVEKNNDKNTLYFLLSDIQGALDALFYLLEHTGEESNRKDDIIPLLSNWRASFQYILSHFHDTKE